MPDAQDDRPHRKTHSKLKKWVGGFVSVLGLIAILITIWQFLPKASDDDRLLISEDAPEITISADSDWNPSNRRLGRLNIDGAVVRVPDDQVVLANHIHMSNGGKIIGNRFAVIATTIEGGAIDATGDDGHSGKPAGANGENGVSGGEVLIVAARISNTRILANGGNGGNGARGSDGRSGRRGNCDGFGKWRRAQAGQAGGNGGSAGAGGDAGHIILVHSPEFPVVPRPQSVGGLPGTPGEGGNGGVGGRGCTGLDGAQPNASNGAPGSFGSTSSPGKTREPDVFSIPFREIAKIAEEPELTLSSGSAMSLIQRASVDMQ